MSTWDNAKDVAASAGGSDFVKLENDGDSMRVAFCGQPYPRLVVWTGEGYEAFDPNVHSKADAAFKCAANVFDLDSGEMKIWDFGKTVLAQVDKLNKKYGLGEQAFEVTRNGRKGDKKTTYALLPDVKIDEDLAVRIDKTALHDLEAVLGDKDSDSDVPF